VSPELYVSRECGAWCFLLGRDTVIKRHFLGTVGETYFAQFLSVLTVEGIWLFICSCGLPDAIDIKYGYFL
jgi:hypothetical protein